MRQLINSILSALRDLWFRWVDRGRIRCVEVEELPDSLERGSLYVLGLDSPWSAALLCPCGCGKLIHLSFLRTDSPSWKISIDRAGLPTLAPSIWRTDGCRSHFFLRRGAIVWCDKGRRR